MASTSALRSAAAAKALGREEGVMQRAHQNNAFGPKPEAPGTPSPKPPPAPRNRPFNNANHKVNLGTYKGRPRTPGFRENYKYRQGEQRA